MKNRTVITMTAAAGPAGGRRPAGAPEGGMVVLRDGSAVLIRQVRSADAPLLAGGFARLSAASRQMRFLGVKKELSAAELRYFTDVDHHDHEALAALDRAGGHGVGIARYVRDAGDPQAAEIAVTIADDWQGRGLGTELLARLSGRARSEGIRRFTALADAGNVAVAALLRNAGARLVRRGRGTVEYEITLARKAEGSQARVSRSAGQSASGAIAAAGSPGPERVCALSRGGTCNLCLAGPEGAQCYRRPSRPQRQAPGRGALKGPLRRRSRPGRCYRDGRNSETADGKSAVRPNFGHHGQWRTGDIPGGCPPSPGSTSTPSRRNS